MDFNGPLLWAMLLRGRFDSERIHESRFRVFAGHVLAFIQFFCGLKILVVLLSPWDDQRPLLFYLIDFYFFPSGVQRAMFFAVTFIHLHLAYIYWK